MPLGSVRCAGHRRLDSRRSRLAARLIKPFLTLVLALSPALMPAAALAVGENITDVRILDNQRTAEDTVRSIAGVKIGDTLESDTLERVRERLNTAGLFSDVNVWWEQAGDGVRVNIAVKDKFPWAPVPTASWSANNRSLGVVFVHGNLFGRGKQLVAGGRIADVDSGAVLAYRDPAVLGSWIYWHLQGVVQKQVVPEYDNSVDVPESAFRETRFASYGFETTLGIAWLRRLRTQVGWQLQKINVSGSDIPATDTSPQVETTPATRSALVGIGKVSLSFDFRAREFAVMTGTALGGWFDLAKPGFGGDINYWKVGAGFERGVKFFKAHNFIISASTNIGHNLPFWNELTAGGPNLRGYLFQQYRGDTQISGKVEYHFPLFSIGSLDFRALGFYDTSALWFRDVPTFDPLTNPMYSTRDTRDGRTFDAKTEQGFSPGRDIHNAVGGGLRFFLRSVAVPLVGFDAGYGIEARQWRFFLVLGA
jgi:outer membrane protein insertion porin family